jgi:hypothetical protein
MVAATPASNYRRTGDLLKGKTGEESKYSMRKRLEVKRGLGGDEFELLPSSNDGAPARDWSSLAAQNARVSWGKDREGLGLFIGEVSWKRGNKIRHFWLDPIGTETRLRVQISWHGRTELSDDMWVPAVM